ncbi:MAG: alpha/beta hydrolase [Actinomycetaceae bacterium]|nr:alpha/beta hydrolase [Actinomycetaceae bacterium]
MPADNSCVTLPGPWTHRLIQANGAQFHLATAGERNAERPLILLVHGFPQYWWAWRNQIEPLAQAGYEVAALDTRGIGGSDKSPDLHDSLTLSQDLIGVVRALGSRKTVLVGLGRGGALAWSAVSMKPELFAGLVTVSSPHPRTLHRIGAHVTLKTWRHALSTGIPSLTKRGLKSEKLVRALLTEWSAPGNTGASGQADIYSQALNLPGAADVAVDQLRWTWMSHHSPLRRAYLRESGNSVYLPVLAVRGEKDPLLPPRAWDKDREFALGRYTRVQIPGAGHFVPEEQPEKFTQTLLDYLSDLPEL